jgi:putative ABC transport system substrate-binding protein
MVFTGGEANAVVLKNAVEAAATELGLEVIGASIANSAEVKAATESIVDKVDAFYIGTDNTVVSAITALTEVAKNKKKIVFSSDPTSAEKVDVLVAWGFDYYKMGLATGKLIGQILAGKKTSEFPTQYLTDAKDMSILVNLDVAKALGITFDKAVVESAAIVVENGTATKK